jgi:AraC-like DNA-binding protein
LKTLVDTINGAWHWTREAHHQIRAMSPRGHTVHFVETGGYELSSAGSVYEIEAGDIIYYEGLGAHTWRGDERKVSFYSINFLPIDLKVPSLEYRVLSNSEVCAPWFAEVHERFSRSPSPENRAAAIVSLHRILAFVFSRIPAGASAVERGLWPELEDIVRERRLFKLKVEELAALSGYCVSTIFRACERSTGLSPHRRLREMRMEEAKGLLLHSSLSIGEISAELGYPRIHEFSREFAGRLGATPTEFRAGRA